MHQQHRPEIGQLVFSPAFYNAMPSVEDADAEIRRSDKLMTAASVLTPIYAAHDVIDLCGINLLHSHWPVHAGEIPEQVREADGEAFQLVTRPTHETRGVPASWAVQSNGLDTVLRSFEFSADAGVDELYRHLATKPDFFGQAMNALVTHGLEKDFGICITSRRPLCNDAEAHMVERSAGTRRESTIKPMALEELPHHSLIQTSWRFIAVMDSNSACVKGGCIAGRSSCEALHNPDGSKGAHTKLQNHDTIHESDPRA
jgi:hypothetical protein